MIIDITDYNNLNVGIIKDIFEITDNNLYDADFDISYNIDTRIFGSFSVNKLSKNCFKIKTDIWESLENNSHTMILIYPNETKTIIFAKEKVIKHIKDEKAMTIYNENFALNLVKIRHDFRSNNFFEMKKQINYMSSINHNDSFDKIESTLNSLYEKTRLLQDCIDYTKMYLEETITESSLNCYSLIKAIETERDSIKNEPYIDIPVSFINSNNNFKDRNLKSLPENTISNKNITLAPAKESEVPVEKYKIVSNNIPYKNNIDEFSNSNIYRSYYLLDNPIKEGVVEKITAYINDKLVNSVAITTANCNLNSVKYYCTDNTIEYTSGDDINFTKNRYLKAIEIELYSKHVKPLTYQVDTMRMSSNFWDEVKKYNYSIVSGNTSIVNNLYTLSGMEEYKKAYESYQRDMKEWTNNRYDYEKVVKEWDTTKTEKPVIVGNSVDVSSAYLVFGDDADYIITGHHEVDITMNLDELNLKKLEELNPNYKNEEWYKVSKDNYEICTYGLADSKDNVKYIPGYVPKEHEYIVGGTKAILGIGETDNPNGAKRICGQNRYETFNSILDEYNQFKGKETVEHHRTEETIAHEKPKPVFNSDVRTITKYEYFFGLDDFIPHDKIIEKECAFVSEAIEVGKLDKNKNQYIQINCDYKINERSSIEFYILDGEIEIPIMPELENYIYNEKIFYGLDTRFEIKDNSYVIAIDGEETNLKLSEAKTKDNATISYEPTGKYLNKYTPLNTSVKIKAILRLYDENFPAPFLNKITIRKRGDSKLWEDI